MIMLTINGKTIVFKNFRDTLTLVLETLFRAVKSINHVKNNNLAVTYPDLINLSTIQ